MDLRLLLFVLRFYAKYLVGPPLNISLRIHRHIVELLKTRHNGAMSQHIHSVHDPSLLTLGTSV